MRRVLVGSGLLFGLLAGSDAFAAKKLVFKASIIEGEPQKPDVAVFVSRQNLNKAYELELKESFIPKILESVEHPPF